MAASPDDQRTSGECPRALVVCGSFPLPAVSGGRKRAVALIDAMQRAGLRPRVLTLDADRSGHREAHDRGWEVDALSPGEDSVRRRLAQHARLEPVPTSSALAERVAQLAPSAALVEFEEIDVVQYLGHTRALAPSVVSMYNVDSVARDPVQGLPAGPAQLRARYHRERMRTAERRAARLGEAVVVVSESDRAHFERLGARRTVLAPNGVEPHLLAMKDRPSRARDILFFGQATWAPNAEGLRRFVAAGWPRVRAAHPAARLRIVGPGTARAFAALHGADGVEVLGLVERIEAELANARAVIAPIWSGGGTRIKVLEAMASARPVIGTPAAVEQIGFADGHHGLIAGTEEALADGLIHMLSAPAAADHLGAQAREHARAFVWDRVTAPAEALYRELSERAARREVLAA